MNAKKIKEELNKVLELQEVYVRIGNDAYPAIIKFCDENGKIIPYIQIDKGALNCHRNYAQEKEINL